MPLEKDMTEESNEKERNLIQNAIQVFMTYGIKSVTMDDMARHMRVSKKTIYQFVKDKGDLVNKCMGSDCNYIQDQIKEVVAQNLNAIDENFGISRVMIRELRNVHPSIFYDLEKYYPEAMKTMHKMRHEFIAECVKKNLIRGIKEGLYRDDINVDIMTQLWVLRMNAIFDPSLFPMQEFHPKDVYLEMFVHHIRGIASEKGLKILDEKLLTLT